MADWCESSRLVAVDATTHAVRWVTDAGALGLCLGVAVSTAKGVVVANDWDARSLLVHRLTDGLRLHSIAAPRIGSYMATDPVTEAMYSGGFCDGICSVLSWRWAADGSGLQCDGPVAAAGTAVVSRPLAVMPPAPGKLTSYLIVGVRDAHQLRVLSLPGLALVHEHTLKGMHVVGLAADPWGGALAVCDAASRTAHVLAWPLPGMPPLE